MFCEFGLIAPPFSRNSDEGSEVENIPRISAIIFTRPEPYRVHMEIIEETDIKYVHRFRNASQTHRSSLVLQIFVVTFIRKIMD